MHEISQFYKALAKNYGLVPTDMVFHLKSLAVFVFISALFFIFVEARGGPRSLRQAITFALGPEIFRTPSTRIDVLNFLLSFSFFSPVLAAVSSLIVGVSISESMVDMFGPRNPIVHNDFVIVAFQLITLYLASEFGFYITHVLAHKVDILWALHRPHHSAENANIFATFRGHPLDGFLQALGIAAVVGTVTGPAFYFAGTPLLPETTAAFGFYTSIFLVFNLFHHSNVWISFGKWDKLFSGPIMHQLHHSAELGHRDKNFGGSLMLFDWMFGTLYLPDWRETYRWGLNDEELGSKNPHNRIRDFYVEPIKYILARRRSLFIRGG